jgi:Domain of unknown function (DUF4338)
VEPIRLQGRTLTGDDLTELRALRAQHPDWHRTALSRHLCQVWNWRNGLGRLKDMAARTLLLKLEARGLIDLPPSQSCIGRPCAQAPPILPGQLLALSPPPVEGSLQSLEPIRLELADSQRLRQQVRQFLRQFHYRGFHGPVGENVQYLAKDRQGRDLAVMVFGAAAWKVADRDRFIGWSVEQRTEQLGGIANQQRFLILPWVRVPQLASHLLVLAARRLANDWLKGYGHRVWLLETFVEQGRFTGSAYQAAGWLRLGQTTGRTRQDRQRTLQAPIKSVWVRPLHPQFRKLLSTL